MGDNKSKKTNKKRRKVRHTRAFIRKRRVKQDRYLEILASNGCKQTRAAEQAGIAFDTVLDWRESDKVFEKKFLRVYRTIAIKAEEEAMRRGMEGYPGRPVVHEGRIVREIKEYSDTLLKSVLAAHDKRYRTGEVDLGAGSTAGEFSITIKAHPGTSTEAPKE